MKKPYIDALFPVPIGLYTVNELSENEINFLNQKENNLEANHGNHTSIDKYVLRNTQLKELEKALLLIVNNFIKSVYDPKDKELVSYITQSWINITTQQGHHHMHNHPNSFLSGVLYYDVGDNDSIMFTDTRSRLISLDTENYNKFSSTYWRYDVSNKDVVLFPSTLWHSVEPKKDNKKRKSLAFNVFLKGRLGNVKGLTELIL